MSILKLHTRNFALQEDCITYTLCISKMQQKAKMCILIQSSLNKGKNPILRVESKEESASFSSISNRFRLIRKRMLRISSIGPEDVAALAVVGVGVDGAVALDEQADDAAAVPVSRGPVPEGPQALDDLPGHAVLVDRLHGVELVVDSGRVHCLLHRVAQPQVPRYHLRQDGIVGLLTVGVRIADETQK